MDAPDGDFHDGLILDYVTGVRWLKDTPRERVRQQVAILFVQEYGIALSDIEMDFPLSLAGSRRKLDLAAFAPGTHHSQDTVARVALCRPEPDTTRRAFRIRDYDQAAEEMNELTAIMAHLPSCTLGLWTNGIEFFYVQRTGHPERYGSEPIADWPPANPPGPATSPSSIRARATDELSLRTTFRRCHNFVHGNEGMPKDAAFWQFLYLIYCKMHDEQAVRERRRFWAGLRERFSDDGRRQIHGRILSIFEDVKAAYPDMFRGNEEITLSDRALAFMVSELSRHELTATGVDVKGAAYQEIVGTNLRGDRGQYFTPRGVVKLVVDVLDPKESETILDPACGTGGFLVATLAHLSATFSGGPLANPGELPHVAGERLRAFASTRLFGADFDPFLVRACQMNMVMAGDGRGHLYNINSLEFPYGRLSDVTRAACDIPLESVDVVMTNPPFGSEIPVTEPSILTQYDLAHVWEPQADGNYRRLPKMHGSVAPEVLFIERCLSWLKPGGRMGIVLPDGILSNPAAQYIRWWILQHAWVIASIDLPVEAFIVEANVNILTSLVFLRKKSPDDLSAQASGRHIDYPVFMAVVDKVGYDRRGKKLFKRDESGREILHTVTVPESIAYGDRMAARQVHRHARTPDDDLPEAAKAYHAFREEQSRLYPHLRFD